MQARSLLRLLFLSAGPVMLSLPMLFLLANILMDKASLLGVLPPPLGPAVSDAIVGAVVGLAVALCSSSIVTWVGTVLSRRQVQVSSCNAQAKVSESHEDCARTSICPCSGSTSCSYVAILCAFAAADTSKHDACHGCRELGIALPYSL